jgi:hypothetical protein
MKALIHQFGKFALTNQKTRSSARLHENQQLILSNCEVAKEVVDNACQQCSVEAVAAWLGQHGGLMAGLVSFGGRGDDGGVGAFGPRFGGQSLPNKTGQAPLLAARLGPFQQRGLSSSV